MESNQYIDIYVNPNDSITQFISIINTEMKQWGMTLN